MHALPKINRKIVFTVKIQVFWNDLYIFTRKYLQLPTFRKPVVFSPSGARSPITA